VGTAVYEKIPVFSIVPGVLAAILGAVLINQGLQAFYPELALSGNHLVTIPVLQQPSDLLSQLHYPDFSSSAIRHLSDSVNAGGCRQFEDAAFFGSG